MLKSFIAVAALGGLLAVSALGWSAVPEAPPSQDDATYLGAASCKKCHFKQHKTWAGMKHANAWDSLAEKYHDPAQVDDSGRSCVSCHATGTAHPDKGGFTDVASTPEMLGVQCEACHGPGSLHKDAGTALMKDKRKNFEEGEETYITLVPTNCAGCHNPHVSHAEYADG